MSRGRMVFLCFLSLVPLMWVGCVSNSPPQAIIGAWEYGIGEKKQTMVFWDNGVWSMETGGTKETGNFKFADEKHIEMSVDVPTDTKPIVYKRSISFSHHDKMNMTDLDTGRRMIWRRIVQK